MVPARYPLVAIIFLAACGSTLEGGPQSVGGQGSGADSGSSAPPVPNVPPPRTEPPPQPTTPTPPAPMAMVDAGTAAPPQPPPVENPPPAEEPNESPATQTNPDAFQQARSIGPGDYSDIALDSSKRILHLIYIKGDAVLYRSGTLQGVFQEPEVLAMGGGWNYARIILDKDGAPHVTYAALVDTFYHGKSNYYTNKIGGEWKMPLKVFDRVEENADWTNNPTIAIDSDLTVFMATKMKEPVTAKIARIEDAAGTPKVALKATLGFSAPNLIINKGTLMVTGHGGGGWKIQPMDKATLKAMGAGFTFGAGLRTEQSRAYTDHRDDVHVSFGANGQPVSSTGYYTSLERLKANQPPIRYPTTNRHHSGNGRVVRDQVAADRVYVFHWSGGGGDGVFPQCEAANRVHFVRIEEGRKVQDLRPITDRPGGHGPSFRMQPAAAAHPNGGVAVVYTECASGKEPSLWFTRVGAYGN